LIGEPEEKKDGMNFPGARRVGKDIPGSADLLLSATTTKCQDTLPKIVIEESHQFALTAMILDITGQIVRNSTETVPEDLRRKLIMVRKRQHEPS
jgi:hypothetical protein